MIGSKRFIEMDLSVFKEFSFLKCPHSISRPKLRSQISCHAFSCSVAPLLYCWSTSGITKISPTPFMGSRESMACSASADARLGPLVASCRRQLDFTFLFEDAMLSMTPSFIFLVLSTMRLKTLISKRRRVCTGYLHRLKIVRSFPTAKTSPLYPFAATSCVAFDNCT